MVEKELVLSSVGIAWWAPGIINIREKSEIILSNRGLSRMPPDF